MTRSTSTYHLRAFRHLAVSGVAALALVTLGACSKSSDAATGSASATGSGASTPGTPAAGKKPKATLKLADMKAAYKSVFDGPTAMKDSLDKKVAAYVAKVGQPPTSDDGRKKDWYALDGDNCSKVEIDGKDGSIMDMTTDKSDCGM
jgi:hypothetical protein